MDVEWMLLKANMRKEIMYASCNEMACMHYAMKGIQLGNFRQLREGDGKSSGDRREGNLPRNESNIN